MQPDKKNPGKTPPEIPDPNRKPGMPDPGKPEVPAPGTLPEIEPQTPSTEPIFPNREPEIPETQPEEPLPPEFPSTGE